MYYRRPFELAPHALHRDENPYITRIVRCTLIRALCVLYYVYVDSTPRNWRQTLCGQYKIDTTMGITRELIPYHY